MRWTVDGLRPAPARLNRTRMKIELLPSTIGKDGRASGRQHLSCLIVDDRVAIDAGCLAQSCSTLQRNQVRNVVLTHAHLDHIAGLPLFVDDLFATIRQPIVVHAIPEVVEVLERDVFNWSVYPRFSELSNEFGSVMEYRSFASGDEIDVAGLSFLSIPVNHKVPAVGFIVDDGAATIAITGDTAELDGFWDVVNDRRSISALIIECAFPDELGALAELSHHLTPRKLKIELAKLKHDCPIYVMSLKPAYLDIVRSELYDLGIENLTILAGGEKIEIGPA